MSEFTRVIGVNELEAGRCTTVVANDKEIALFNVDGAFHAIDNTCTHHGGPLGQGDMEGCVVSCPWHGWTFDVTTGNSLINSEFSVQKYEVQIDGENVLIKV